MKAAVCPDAHTLAALLESEIAEGGTEYSEHLETCTHCQQTLAELAADELSWKKLARYLPRVEDKGAGQTPSCEPALERGIVQFKNELTLLLKTAKGVPDEDLSLSFLRAADRPELLGYLNDYEVQEVIGRGGMGVVFKAFDPVLHRLVVIKVMAAALAGSANARRRFTREAQAVAAVCHDHIVTIHGVYEADGLPYLVMQYIAGESLQARLDRTGPLEVAEIVRIGLQTALGLAAAHAQGLIHRDIKPANLLLENGLARVRITDFGLARMTDDVQLTQNGVVAGTLEYMAPEQARGESVDHRADLFSLGSVLYTLCTGVPPFRGSSTVAVLRQVSDQVPTDVQELNPEVSAWLAALIARLMAKAPADRFQSAAEVAALLEGYLAHLRQPTAVLAPPFEIKRQGDKDTPAHSAIQGNAFSLAVGLLVCLLAALGFGMGFWFAGSGDAPDPQTRLSQDYYESFKGQPENRDAWTFCGPDAEQCVKYEPTGLRITLPRGYSGPAGLRGDRQSTGLATTFSVKGDFEITVGFDILQEPEPPELGTAQTRVSLELILDTPQWQAASASRKITSEEGNRMFTVWQSLLNQTTGKKQEKVNSLPTNAKTGQLRLVRIGSDLSCYVAESAAADFTLLKQQPFTQEDVREVQLVGSTGGANVSLDVRFTDFRIRAASLSGLPTVASMRDGSKGWLVAVFVGVGISLALMITLGVWLFKRQGDRVETLPAQDSIQDQPANSEAVAPPVSFSCSGCGKHLKAKAELAGKKVKCSRCGKAVLVLEIKPDEGIRLSK
jgi:serine/threonine protein kinase/DNA-directed RNA polymerase subunit RPC12/RpoP